MYGCCISNVNVQQLPVCANLLRLRGRGTLRGFRYFLFEKWPSNDEGDSA